ncbi:Alpha/Beta hydrolase protein [Aspergillus crustosus]
MENKAQFAPAWLEFINELGETPALYGSLEEIESAWLKLGAKMMAKYEVPPPDDSVQTQDISLRDFWVRVYTPPNLSLSSKKPVGVYFHGGGWAMGSVDQEDAICRLVAKHHSMTVVSVSYRLAPKYKYPAALDDGVKAVNWVVEKFQPPSVLLLGGSAGGNLAFGTALRLIDSGRGDLVAGIIALVPVTIHPDAVPTDIKAAGRYTSYDTNADATVNTKSAMETFFAAYEAPIDDKYTSCILHPRLNELKKVYIAECGADTLRDDARLMKAQLEDVGVPVGYDAYPGFPHYSWTFPAACLGAHRGEFLGRMLDGVGWVGGFEGGRSMKGRI